MFCYQVRELLSLTNSVTQIFLEPKQEVALTYEAGQYVNVIHQDHSVSPLSIACAPNEAGLLEFHLFHAEHNKKAHDLVRMALQEKKWEFSGPLGSSTVSRLQANKPTIFLARGTGFAPIKAVITALTLSPPSAPLYFYWSVKTPNDIYLLDVIEQWVATIPGFTFIPVFTQEIGSHILPDVILRDHADLTHFQVYASGPQPLVAIAYADFVQRGLARDSFYSDVLA